MNKESIKLFDLPYSKVIEIYNEYMRIKDCKNSAAKTRLFKKHPDIFHAEVRNEIEAISGLAEKSLNESKKRIDITPYLKKKK